METLLAKTRRVVIKLGTNILTSGIGQLNEPRIGRLCEEIRHLHARGIQVIVVSSGAVGLGMGKLKLTERPTRLSQLQMCAAIGQSILMQTWQRGMEPHGLIASQVLLTREDVSGRKRHVALRDMLEECLSNGITPIVNENDSVSADEIKFGDNDVLSALVASLCKSDLLIILSTAPGVVDMTGDGKIIPVVEKITPEIKALAGGPGSTTSVGGMITKIEAARIATTSGCAAFIGSGEDPAILTRMAQGQATGTFFPPAKTSLQARKRWIAFFETPRGTLTVDTGATTALTKQAASLLPKGITAVNGNFAKGDIVEITTEDGSAFARGIAQYSSEHLAKAIGKKTDELKQIFPSRKRHEAVHRDGLVLLG